LPRALDYATSQRIKFIGITKECPMKLLSVVGARPNFMKIAPIAAELGKYSEIEHRIVHSGQHYDELLSRNFFSDLKLPDPDINLEVGSGSHATQTAEVMKRLEPILLEYRPEMVIVVGDVNSTLAAALTAVKLEIPVAHVEAGLRSFDMTMPEEINRRLTDAISKLLFVTERSGVDNLKREGIASEKLFLVGNVMIDSLRRHREVAERSPILNRLGIRQNGSECEPYGVLTLHRPSNADNRDVLDRILDAVRNLAADFPIFFPIHPRTRKNIERFGYAAYLANADTPRHGLIALDPLGYLDFLCLLQHARLVLTDSGGIQEETTVLGVPCLTLRKNTERPATVEYGTNQIVGSNPDRILSAAQRILKGAKAVYRCPPLWDGNAAGRIVNIIRDHLAQQRVA
jgi:UDP-N-acetylglucosamine 2-epimerase (non-hydrolysing)